MASRRGGGIVSEQFFEKFARVSSKFLVALCLRGIPLPSYCVTLSECAVIGYGSARLVGIYSRASEHETSPERVKRVERPPLAICNSFIICSYGKSEGGRALWLTGVPHGAA